MATITSYAHLPAHAVAALESDQTIDITTTGRRTGEPRRIEIWFLNKGGAIYIAGSPGKRDWLANLSANPDFVFHLKESVSIDLAAIATLVDDEVERRALFESAASQWYRNHAELQALVDQSPVIRVAFDSVIGRPDDPQP